MKKSIFTIKIIAVLTAVSIVFGSALSAPSRFPSSSNNSSALANGLEKAEAKDQSGIMAVIDKIVYSVHPDSVSQSRKDQGGYRAYNPSNHYEVGFKADQIELKTASRKKPTLNGETRWSARKWGYADQLQPLESAQVQVKGNRVEYQRGEITEWYVNDKEGMEQGFTIHQRPASEKTHGLLQVQMELSGSLTAELSEDGQTVWLKNDQGQKVMKYGGLFAYDAKGRKLPSQMLLADNRELTLQVNDRHASYPVTIDPKFNMADVGGHHNLYGWSVDISGDRFVVGVPGFREGMALVYVRDPNAVDGWKLENTLVPPSQDNFPGNGDYFGASVAISGDTVAVGERGGFDVAIQQGEAGSVYVYVRDPNNVPTWSLQQKLQGDNPKFGDAFGSDIDIDKNLLVVGAPGGIYEIVSSYAYLFSRKSGIWSQAAKVSPPEDEKNTTFGSSVAIANSIFVVGGECNHYYMNIDSYPIGEGSVYVYSPYIVGGPSAWSLEKKLVPDEPVIHVFSDDEQGLSKNYGFDVDIKYTQAGGLNGNDIYTVAVGQPDNSKLEQPGNDPIPYDYGSVFVFERTSPTFFPWSHSWKQTQKLQASDKAANLWNQKERFGYSVAVSPDRIVVSAPQAWLWVPQFNSPASTGAAYVFSKQNGLWNQLTKLHDPELEPGAAFGFDVAVDKTTGIFGIPYDNIKHSNNGFYADQGSVWAQELLYFIPNFPDPPEFP